MIEVTIIAHPKRELQSPQIEWNNRQDDDRTDIEDLESEIEYWKGLHELEKERSKQYAEMVVGRVDWSQAPEWAVGYLVQARWMSKDAKVQLVAGQARTDWEQAHQRPSPTIDDLIEAIESAINSTDPLGTTHHKNVLNLRKMAQLIKESN